MSSGPILKIVSRFYEAIVKPDLWPAALEAVAEFAGAAGATYLHRHIRTGLIQFLVAWGPVAEAEAGYIDRYAGLDPYAPVLNTAAPGTWLRATDCLPEAVLRGDEWYNEALLKRGIDDVLGIRLFATWSHAASLRLYQGVAKGPISDTRFERLHALAEPLAKAARLHFELRNLAWKSSLAIRTLDRLSAGVVITDSDGRIIEINAAAERIAQRDDSLSIRNGRLLPGRAFENSRLAKLIEGAAGKDGVATPPAYMAIGRCDGLLPYVLSIGPLVGDLAPNSRPCVVVLIADPEGQSPSDKDLAEVFGLTPAESRIATGLIAGRKLNEIAADCGVRITTARTHLRNISKKVGVSRQTDLVRALAGMLLISGQQPRPHSVLV